MNSYEYWGSVIYSHGLALPTGIHTASIIEQAVLNMKTHVKKKKAVVSGEIRRSRDRIIRDNIEKAFPDGETLPKLMK